MNMNKTWKKRKVRVVAVGIIFLIIIYFLYKILLYLQQFGLTLDNLNHYSNLILIVVTAVYAYLTYNIVQITKKQIVADIHVFNKVLGSSLVEGWYLKKIKEQPEETSRRRLTFRLLFDVRNKNSGSGCIDKPDLVLKFNNDNFEYKISPQTKESWDERIEDGSNMQAYRTIVKDLGGTIFLRGGESKKIELEYEVRPEGDLSTHIREHLDSLMYCIRYTDNLGEDHLIKVDKIKEEKEVKRL